MITLTPKVEKCEKCGQTVFFSSFVRTYATDELLALDKPIDDLLHMNTCELPTRNARNLGEKDAWQTPTAPEKSLERQDAIPVLFMSISSEKESALKQANFWGVNKMVPSINVNRINDSLTREHQIPRADMTRIGFWKQSEVRQTAGTSTTTVIGGRLESFHSTVPHLQGNNLPFPGRLWPSYWQTNSMLLE